MFAPGRRIDNAHEDGIWTVCWTSKGHLVSGSVDETVKVWTAGKKPEVTKAGHMLGVTSVVCDKGGTTAFAASIDSTIRSFNIETGESGAVIDAGPVECWTLALSPDDKHIASGSSRGTVNVWDVESQASAASMEGGTGFVMAVAYSPNGSILAASSDHGTIALYDVVTSKLKAKLDAGPRKAAIRSLAFMSDGSVLLAASDDARVHAYDVDRLGTSPFWSFDGHSSWVLGVATHPTETRHFASSGADRTVKLWDFNAKASVATLESHHHDHVWDVAYSHDGTQLASCSDDASLQVYFTDPTTTAAAAAAAAAPMQTD